MYYYCSMFVLYWFISFIGTAICCPGLSLVTNSTMAVNHSMVDPDMGPVDASLGK
jgi:hypothetical protein